MSKTIIPETTDKRTTPDLYLCHEPECDMHGEVEDFHCHTKALGSLGDFKFGLIHTTYEGDEWEVTVDHPDPHTMNRPVSIAEAKQLLYILAIGIEEAERLGRRTLRRPAEACAEPQHDGIGGGL